MRRRRFDAPDSHELAAQRLNAGVGPYEPLPEQLRQYNGKRIVLLAALALLAAVVIGGHSGSSGPPVAGSCTKPAFAFDHVGAKVDGIVRWSVAGPSGAYVLITADSTDAGRGRLAGPVEVKGCRASGRIGVTLHEGRHLLRVFLRSPDGVVTLVGQQPLRVDPLP